MTYVLSNAADCGDRFIAPGTLVCIPWFDEAGQSTPEFGIIVHCWWDDEMQWYDCYFASFGSAFPEGKPDERPAILKYGSRSFRAVEGPSPEPSDASLSHTPVT